jgi:hypothetical protein
MCSKVGAARYDDYKVIPVPSAFVYPYDLIHNEENPHHLQSWYNSRGVARREYRYFLPNNNNTSKSYSYIHVHKGGGTQFKKTTFPKSLFVSDMDFYQNYRDTYPLDFQRITHEWIDYYQPDKHEFFTFFRDPATRFLSAEGQVYTTIGQRKAVFGSCRNLAVTESTISMLHCILDKIEYNQPNCRAAGDEIRNSNYTSIDPIDSTIIPFHYLDVHLLPQTYEQYNAIYEQQHIPVRSIELSHMNAFFDNCNATQPTQRKKAMYGINIVEDTNHDNTNNTTNDIPRRLDTSNTVSRLDKTIYDVDPSLLKRVCNIYQIDVDMIKVCNQKVVQKNFIQSLCL